MARVGVAKVSSWLATATTLRAFESQCASGHKLQKSAPRGYIRTPMIDMAMSYHIFTCERVCGTPCTGCRVYLSHQLPIVLPCACRARAIP